MPAEHEPTETGGLTRRQLVTRGAIAGGLVWAAPVIRTTAAYATTANGTERPCQNFYMVVINPAGHVLPAPAQRQGNEVPPKIRAWFRDNPSVPVQYPSVTPQLTAVSNEEAAVLLPAVTGPNAAGRQCRMVLGFGRKGNTFAEAFVDPDPPIAVAVGRRLIFPCPRGSMGASGVADTTVTNAADAPASSTTTSTSTTTTTTTTTAAAPDASGQPVAAFGAAGNANNQGQNGNSQGNGNGNGNGQGQNSGNGNSQDNGNGHCFDALYLIYCCPR